MNIFFIVWSGQMPHAPGPSSQVISVSECGGEARPTISGFLICHFSEIILRVCLYTHLVLKVGQDKSCSCMMNCRVRFKKRMIILLIVIQNIPLTLLPHRVSCDRPSKGYYHESLKNLHSKNENERFVYSLKMNAFPSIFLRFPSCRIGFLKPYDYTHVLQDMQ